VQRLLALYQQQLAAYKREKGSAQETAGDERAGKMKPAEQAAWTIVANIMLNMDETLTKE
jgi:hypothetical protein